MKMIWRFLLILLLIGLPAIGYTRISKQCLFLDRGEPIFIGSQACFDQLPNEEVKGLWVITIEGSMFVPNISHKISSIQAFQRGVYLDVSGNVEAKGVLLANKDKEVFYSVDLVVKNPKMRGSFGPRGAYDKAIFLTKINKMKLLS